MLFFVFLLVFLSFSYLQSKQQIRRKSLPLGPPGLPIIGHLPHRTLHRLSHKYGPVMGLKLGSGLTVVVSSPEAAELFLKTHDLNFANRPRRQAYELITYGNKGIAFSEYGPYWRDLRKLCIFLASPRLTHSCHSAVNRSCQRKGSRESQQSSRV